MKKSLLIATLAVAAVQPSHALFGLGMSYGRNFTTIDGTHETIGAADLPEMIQAYGPDGASLSLHRDKVEGLTQLGVKTWLDLPLIPVEFEGAANLSFGAYASYALLTGPDSSTVVVPTTIDIPLDLAGAGEGKTPYTSLALDVSVRYPFLSLPPLSPLKPLKFYVGAGASWIYATRVVSKDDIKELFPTVPTSEVTESVLKDELKDNIYESTFGGHLLLGTQFKLPIIPLAIFVDGKWHFNAATSEAATANPFSVSAGAAFAL